MCETQSVNINDVHGMNENDYLSLECADAAADHTDLAFITILI